MQTTPQTVASGQTPISIDWDYNNLAYGPEFPSANWKVNIPADGVYGAYYCAAINATGPHPNAARLWQELCYSDQGQLIWLKGFAHPARFTDLAGAKGDPQALLTALPQAALYNKVKFASLGQQNAAKAIINTSGPRRSGPSALATHAVASDGLRPGPTPGRRRPLVCLAGRRPVLCLRHHVPDPAGCHRDGRRLQGPTAAAIRSTTSRRSSRRRTSATRSGRASGSASRRRSSAGCFGLLIAYAAIRKGTPGWIRSVFGTFSGVAANFGGIPLAFAFIATLGTIGIVTQFINNVFGINIYDHGFAIWSRNGVELVYLYFQIPLMILVIAPAIDGLRAEWSEASSNLGASRLQYWRHIGMPVLMPSILGAVILLFGNSFAAYATAYSLTSGTGLPLVPILIGNDLSGNVLSNPHEGQALAFGMFFVLAAMMVFYVPLQRRASRWAR